VEDLTAGRRPSTEWEMGEEGHPDTERMMRFSHFTIERAAEAIFWIDSDARIIRANEAACRSLGYTMDELLAMRVHDIDPEYTLERWPDFWARLRGTVFLVFDSRHRRKDGSVFPVEVSCNYIEFEGKGYTCTFARNITERIRREETLKSALDELAKLKKRLQAENIYLQDEINLSHNFKDIITHSRAFKKVLSRIEQVAPTDATVLIRGETGAGKELVARAVHRLSRRHDRPLVKVNCAALPSTLIESELFGHEKGAFTGALAKKAGRFELADGGTIFLDEIGDLPPELQAKLLRVLQEGEFERLGSPHTRRVDVRVLTATHKDLEGAIEGGLFRQDLYYRLNVFPITCPPLRDRREDIPILVKHFAKVYASRIGKAIETIPIDVMEALQSYAWPGNVRELQNVIERAVIISKGKTLDLGEWLPPRSAPPPSAGLATLREVEERQEQIERDHILDVLQAARWRVRGPHGAAAVLGLKPTTLEARMKRLGIRREK